MCVGLAFDPIFLEHRNPPGHPERVERLTAIRRELDRQGLGHRCEAFPGTRATPEVLARVHSLAYIEALDKLAGKSGYLDADTYVSPCSIEAAYTAAGTAAALAEAVWRGNLAAGMALLRPPGHHAEADRGMGFCLCNNIAVAAAALRASGADRIAIVDWDVHHGNGTQHSFEADPHVLFLSTHQYPFYPGTGAMTETGRGEGEGYTVNLPMPAGCGDAEYFDAFDTVILPILEQYRPEIILVSAGFDTYKDDPLASMQVMVEGFLGLAARLRALAGRICGGKLVYFLEGGYELTGLAQGVAACVHDLLDPQPIPASQGGASSRWLDTRARIQTVQRAYWQL